MHYRAVLVLGFVLATSIDLERGLLGQEQSVRPGINSKFLNPDVAQWIKNFERDGRDIYDHRQDVVDACQITSGMSVADVGAGTGLFTRLFAVKVGEIGTAYAVDISEDFIRHIESSCQENRLANVHGIVCRADDAMLPPASVDLIFICDTYHHFEFPQKTLASLYKALKPSGHLMLIDFERIEGQSSQWTLNHVRAGKEVFTHEIQEAGFELIEEFDLLKDKYMLRFKRR